MWLRQGDLKILGYVPSASLHTDTTFLSAALGCLKFMWENTTWNIFTFQDGNLVKVNVGAAKRNLCKEKKRIWCWPWRGMEVGHTPFVFPTGTLMLIPIPHPPPPANSLVVWMIFSWDLTSQGWVHLGWGMLPWTRIKAFRLTYRRYLCESWSTQKDWILWTCHQHGGSESFWNS